MRTRTFRESLQEPTWTLDGDGLSSTDRREFKPQLAAVTMIDALAAEPAFWRDADAVATAQFNAHRTAWQLSLRYARSRQRREVIALLLEHAADAADERHPSVRLYGLTVRAWSSADDPPGRPSSYTFRDDFRLTILDGAELLARRAGDRCFTCNRPAKDGDYCRADDRKVSPRTRAARERSIERLFRYARGAPEHRL